MKNSSKNNYSEKNSKKYNKNSDPNFSSKNTNSSKKNNKFFSNYSENRRIRDFNEKMKGKVTFHL